MTATIYKLITYDPASGAKTGEILDYRKLFYRKRVGEVGAWGIEQNGASSKVALFVDKAPIQITRRNAGLGIAEYTDFDGMFRDPEYETTQIHTFRPDGFDWKMLLQWRYVGYYAGVAGRTQFTATPIETIMKSVVSYNAGPNATTANGRVRTPGGLGLTVETDLGRGSTVDWSCAWENVLTTLQKLAARASGRTTGDFDVIRTGATTREFRYYPGQRGTDRSATVTFSLEYGNMRNPKVRIDRSSERTAAIVAGQGEGLDRQIRVRTGAGYSATNDIEMFVQATDIDAKRTDALTALDARGDSALDEARARTAFTFDVIQAGARVYGRDYDLGDLVRARYTNPSGVTIDSVQRIVGVEVSVEPSERVETIKLEFEDV